ncbi:MAG: DJ-1/PfpI family protein [Solirubrobacterales bacterium]|nr:DJ-1/PfpI family protein [Solirubrobacterales bacterium]MBV9714140.1 DJ-1/PfpI family protein [Solirubrobacterales bacterium]
MRIAVLVYEGFDELDAVGPFEVLRNAAAAGAEAEVSLVTLRAGGQVTGSHGLLITPQATLETGGFDLVVVPGGGWNDRAPAGAYAEAQSGEIPTAIRRLHADGATVAAVCTGAMLVSAAGLLRGRPATTHRGARDDLGVAGAELVDARVVDDGDLLTCGGVTSGLDLALWIVEREWGAGLADGIAAEMEHHRRGPVWRAPAPR